MIICLLVLASRYAYLQIFHYDEFSTASDKTVFAYNLSPARGYIYDRNGVLLADNYPVLPQH